MSRRTRIVLVATACLLIVPIAAFASDRFTDVPDDNVFHDDITWLADAKVTLGCNPPANDEFCPKDNVTREQMSAFMRRLAENQVVDAATAIEAENAATALEADHAATADDAETLNGIDSAGFVTSNGGLRMFASARINSNGSLNSAVGPVESAEPISVGEYRITFSEDFISEAGGPAFPQVSGLHIDGHTCSWRYDGGSQNSLRTVCNEAAGALANTSHTVVVFIPDDGAAVAFTSQSDPTDGS